VTPQSTLLTAAARPIYWLLLVAALWILLRGHNAPGGGFIGGLVAVAGSSLLAIVLGPGRARRLQPLASLPLAMLGVALAVASGLPGALLGLPYLTHLWSPIGLSTVLLFDVGVFLAVWGALTGYVYAILDSLEARP
jgi:multicomponent Na+:H+ antiporter subunit B